MIPIFSLSTRVLFLPFGFHAYTMVLVQFSAVFSFFCELLSNSVPITFLLSCTMLLYHFHLDSLLLFCHEVVSFFMRYLYSCTVLYCTVLYCTLAIHDNV